MHLICQRKLNSYYAQDNYPFGEDITWADNKINKLMLRFQNTLAVHWLCI